MPFTPSHAAIVLPLVKKNPRYFSATALIIGSLAPDFEYFFKFSIDKVHGHTLAGLFYFNLPTVVLLSFLFHGIVKKNLISNLPAELQSRFQPLYDFNFLEYFKNHWLVFCISAIVGAVSHIFWDSFTHSSGFFVRHLPFIYENIRIPFRGVNYTFWYALQNLSTVVGLIIIFIYIRNMPTYETGALKADWRYWMGTVIISALVVTIRFLISPYNGNPVILVITIIPACCIALIIMGLFYRRRGAVENSRNA